MLAYFAFFFGILESLLCFDRHGGWFSNAGGSLRIAVRSVTSIVQVDLFGFERAFSTFLPGRYRTRRPCLLTALEMMF